MSFAWCARAARRDGPGSTLMPRTPGATAIVGVGCTEFSSTSGRTVLELATESARAALDDAGLTQADVDGVATYALGDSVPAQAVATALQVETIDYLLDLSLGGQSASYLLLLADAAIRAGLAKTIVIYRALNGRSGVRIGHARPADLPDSVLNRLAVGLTAYPQNIAMWARRFMIETGATEEDLGAVVLAQRWYAARNPRAIIRKEITLDEYLASPMIASPFRVADCTREVDAACAVVVTSLDRARTLRHPPAVIRGGAFASGPRPGREIGDILLTDDFAKNCMHFVGERIWDRTGFSPDEVDVAQIYDCFSSAVLYGLEGLGFVGKGESGDFIRSGATGLHGSLPVNTSGGLLCEGYVHGMNCVTEAVHQLRGDAGQRTVSGAEVALVSSGTLMDGSAAILSLDA
jgi:acetyl-CoA acetyltransferase